MIVLTSNGMTSDALLQEMKRHIHGGKAALVVTADNEYKEKNYHVGRLTEELRLLGLSVDCFDFDNQKPEELRKYDVVEMIGGNPYYLLRSIIVNGFLDGLKYFSQEKCLIGCSAGAVVVTPSLGLIDRYSPEMNIVGLQNLTACNLTDVQILPHYNKFLSRFENFEEKCRQYETENACTVVRLNDGDAVIIKNEKTHIIRK